MKTISYDSAIYKLVPVAESSKWRENLTKIGYSHRSVIADVLSAVPADLPGVVAHTGEPKCYMRADEDGDILWSEDCCSPDPIDTYDGDTSLPLFTHPPAQPDTAMFNAMLMEASRIDGAMPAQPDTAKAIHYPECWDVAAYPTLESALKEIGAFKCGECQPDTAALQARIADLEAQRDNLIQQAQILAQESRTQRSIVIATLKALGLPENDWEATSLITAKFAVLEAQLAAQAGQELEGDTSGYITTVPDKSDRIVWRNHYYHLPIKTVPAQAGQEPTEEFECRKAFALKSANYLFDHGKRNLGLYMLDNFQVVDDFINRTTPPAPTNSLAIVQALREAVGLRVKLWQNGCDCDAEHTCNPMQDAYAKKWQTILDGMTK